MNLQIKRFLISATLSTFLYPAISLAADAKTVKMVAKRIIIDNVGLMTPESIEYYAAEDVYLVSNINGNALAAEGNGFISKIRPDGSVVKLKWIDGTQNNVHLNAPKGIEIHHGNLYVTDINQIQIFALPSGKQKASINIKGITSGNGNFVYVTDSGLTAGKGSYASSGSDAIYKVWPNGKYELIIQDKIWADLMA